MYWLCEATLLNRAVAGAVFLKTPARLDLDGERTIAGSRYMLLEYLNDRSRIVKTFSLQALLDLAEEDMTLRPKVIQLLQESVKTGSPAMRSRGKKLLDRLL